MPSKPCHFCGFANPADAQFCGGCGGQLSQALSPCPQCGAMNDQGATTCHQCGRSLQGSVNDAMDAAPRAAAPLRPISRPPSRAMVGVLTVTIVAALAYYAYSQLAVFFVVEPWGNANGVPPSRPPGGFIESPNDAKDTAGNSAAVGAINRNAPATETLPAKVEDSAAPASSQAVSPEPARAEPTPSSTPVPPRPSAAESRITEPQRIQPLPDEACTEATAALGLCTPRGAAARQAEEPSRKAGGDQKPSSQPGCTEASVALGLCKS